jgi:hypothetical protein
MRQFLTILSRLKSRADVYHPIDTVRSRGFRVKRALLRRAAGVVNPFHLVFSYSMWFSRANSDNRARSR